MNTDAIKNERLRGKLNDIVTAGLTFLNSLDAQEQQYLHTFHAKEFAGLLRELHIVAKQLMTEQEFMARVEK